MIEIESWKTKHISKRTLMIRDHNLHHNDEKTEQNTHTDTHTLNHCQ